MVAALASREHGVDINRKRVQRLTREHRLLQPQGSVAVANDRGTFPEFRSSRGLWARLRTEISYGMGVSGAVGARRVDFA